MLDRTTGYCKPGEPAEASPVNPGVAPGPDVTYKTTKITQMLPFGEALVEKQVKRLIKQQH
jgi:hypothetical protein